MVDRNLYIMGPVDIGGAHGLVLEFPVVVEVRIVPACDPDEHVDITLGRLTAALEALA